MVGRDCRTEAEGDSEANNTRHLRSSGFNRALLKQVMSVIILTAMIQMLLSMPMTLIWILQVVVPAIVMITMPVLI